MTHHLPRGVKACRGGLAIGRIKEVTWLTNGFVGLFRCFFSPEAPHKITLSKKWHGDIEYQGSPGAPFSLSLRSVGYLSETLHPSR